MYDHFGQGLSDGIRAHVDDVDTQYVADMKSALDQLADPKLPIVVLAHSMGAMIATRFEELYPERVKAYAFSSPMYVHMPCGEHLFQVGRGRRVQDGELVLDGQGWG